MQNRPSTSVKSRMYMAGLQQIESFRGDIESKKSSNQDVMNRTTFDDRFKEFKSKELIKADK